MIKHRWHNNTCIVCGITRERKEYTRVVRTYSRLGTDGIFCDVPVYQYGAGWWYGPVHKFERPDCIKK